MQRTGRWWGFFRRTVAGFRASLLRVKGRFFEHQKLVQINERVGFCSTVKSRIAFQQYRPQP